MLFEPKWKRAVLDEGHKKVGAALDRPCAGQGCFSQFVDVGDRKVGQGIYLEVAPEALGRVEFRRVGRKEDAAAFGQELLRTALDRWARRRSPITVKGASSSRSS